MSNYGYNRENYSGVYTNSEKTWLTILRYGGFLLFGAGIYGIVTDRIPIPLIVICFVFAFILTSINVYIMKKGIERRKALNLKKSGKKRSRR